MARKELTEEQKFGIRLQKCREAKSITQKELADYCGLSKNYISALERGVNKMNVFTLLKCCELLEVTPNTLLNYRKNDRIILELETVLLNMNGIEQQKVLDCIEIIRE